MTLPTSPFRIFPTATRQTGQRFSADRAVCSACLGGTCCSSEDPISLTPFDILRLAAFFNLSPSEFLLRFTQDRFADDADFDRRSYLDDPNSSVITFLRRRANRRTSPCVFLKYIHEPDGTPRRVCSIHDARPLACREYYYDTCKTRWTGELAALQATGYEMVRDKKLGPAEVKAGLQQNKGQQKEMQGALEFAFWTEMRRALHPEAANREGANSFPLAEFQDALDEKLNRMLSSQFLRLEEKYGPEPWGEQLHPYTSGASFATSPECQRLLRLAEQGPRTTLFQTGDYPHYVASRFALPAMQWPQRFRALTARQKDRISAEVEKAEGEAISRICRASLDAADALAGLCGYIAQTGNLLEQEPAETLPHEVLFLLSLIERSGHPCWPLHAGLRQAKKWAAQRAELPSAWSKLLSPKPTRTRRATRHLLATQQHNGSWNSNPGLAQLPNSQADYWRSLLHNTAAGLLALDWSRQPQ